MPDKRANRGRIHHLEYELGFRDDPPGPSDEPGAVRYYNPPPREPQATNPPGDGSAHTDPAGTRSTPWPTS